MICSAGGGTFTLGPKKSSLISLLDIVVEPYYDTHGIPMDSSHCFNYYYFKNPPEQEKFGPDSFPSEPTHWEPLVFGKQLKCEC